MKCTNLGFSSSMMKRISIHTELIGEPLNRWLRTANADFKVAETAIAHKSTNEKESKIIARVYTFTFTNPFMEPHSVEIQLTSASMNRVAYVWEDDQKPLFLLKYRHFRTGLNFFTVTHINPYKHAEGLYLKSHLSVYEGDSPLLRFMKNAGSFDGFEMSVMDMSLENTKAMRKKFNRMRITLSNGGRTDMFVPSESLINMQQRLTKKIPLEREARIELARRYKYLYDEWVKEENVTFRRVKGALTRNVSTESSIYYHGNIETQLSMLEQTRSQVAAFQQERFFHFTTQLTGVNWKEPESLVVQTAKGVSIRETNNPY